MTILQALMIALAVWVITWAEIWYAYPMINTPLVLCPIVGLILGDLTAGIVMGATLQLVFLGAMSIGGTLPADASLGSVIGTAFAITMGQSMETALTFAVPIAVLGSMLTLLKYLINGMFNPYVQKLCEKGDARGLERIHLFISIVPDFPKILALFMALAFGTGFAQTIINAIPPVVQSGLEYASDLMPAVGIALLLKMMWSPKMAVYFFLGVVLVSFFNVPLLAVACLGAVIAVIMVLEQRSPAAQGSGGTAKTDEEDMFND